MQLPDRLVTDEALCFCRAQAGDNDAQDALVRLHLPLVHSLVRRFLGRGADADDLIQQGALGLLQAIRGFDPARGFQFSTYAVPHILGEIRRFLRKATPLHLDRRMQAQARQLRRAQEQLAQALGRTPTLLELSWESGVPAEEIPLALEALRPPLSLEQPADAAQEGASLGELLAAPAAPEGEMPLPTRTDLPLAAPGTPSLYAPLCGGLHAAGDRPGARPFAGAGVAAPKKAVHGAARPPTGRGVAANRNKSAPAHRGALCTGDTPPARPCGLHYSAYLSGHAPCTSAVFFVSHAGCLKKSTLLA